MGAGVILANIFALDASAELALAFVSVVTMSGVCAIGEDNGIGGKWVGIAKKVGSGHGVDGDFQEVHESFVFEGKTDDKLVVYATIFHNAKLF
jgi:hypothetical protein